MNVIHVVESLAIGGLERVVLSLAGWQHARGDNSMIVCLFHEGALAPEARLEGIEVLCIGKAMGPDLRALAALRAALRSKRPDVLHTHNSVAHYYAVAAAAGLRIGRVINTRHGMGPALQNRRLDLLYRAALVGTDTAVAVCRAGRDRFVRARVIPPAKAAVIANGIDVGAIVARRATARAELMAALGRDPASTVIGTVGRLSAVKDHATLLRAVELLRRDGRATELVIVGDGELRAPLEAMTRELGIAPFVHFLGMRQDVGRLLGAFDIFALSSTSEGYSLALVEAAAAALPIVATQVGGNGDIVVEGFNGLLVPPADDAALAHALGRLIDDGALRQRLGDAGRAWALAHSSVEAMGQAYLALYGGAAPVRARQTAVATPTRGTGA